MHRTRINSLRKSWWNYSGPGTYFITINAHNRAHFFGEATKDQIVLNEIGKAALKCWREIPHHFPFAIAQDIVVMPNHIHGILKVILPLHKHWLEDGGPHNKNLFGPQATNLASIIRGYKIGVTKLARSINQNFKWQRGFYDVIILNKTELQRIRQYIANNPKKWIEGSQNTS